MKDPVGYFKNEYKDGEEQLLGMCDPNNPSSPGTEVDKYSPETVLRFYQNRARITPQNSSYMHKMQSYANKMMSNYSKYQQAKNDPNKYNAHIMNNQNIKDVANALRDRISNNVRTVSYDVVPTVPNYDITKLGMDVINESNDSKQLKQFSQKYLQWSVKDQPFQLNNEIFQNDDGQEFFFPSNFSHLKQFKYVMNYYDLKNNYDADKKFTNNTYHHLYDNTVNHNWLPKGTNGGINDSFTRQANNAIGKYQYITYKYMIWRQYYQNKINNIHNFGHYVKGSKRKIQKEINRLCHYHGRYYADTGSWNNHHLIPNKSRVKRIDELAKKRDEIGNWIPNAKSIRQKNYYEKQLTKFNNLIKRQQSSFADQQHKQIQHYIDLGNIYNIKHDTRYTHFGYIRPRNPSSDHSYIYFMVTDESPTFETQVSSTPVEWGVNMTTGTQKQQTQVQIEGILFNINFSNLVNADGKHGYNGNNNDDKTNPFSQNSQPNNNNKIWRQYWTVKDQARTLSSWSNGGKEMFYSGQEWYPHCMISEFNPDLNNSGDDGSETSCSFSMTITLCDYFNSNVHTQHGRSYHHGKKAHSKGKNNSNWKHIRAKAGYTYWGVGMKKGIKVSNLEKWNPWPARRIPIGAEIRYKPNYKHGRKRVHATHRKHHRK